MRQFGDQALRDRLGIAGQRDRRFVQAIVLFEIGIHADDGEVAIEAPLPKLNEKPGADGQNDVGFAP